MEKFPICLLLENDEFLLRFLELHLGAASPFRFRPPLGPFQTLGRTQTLEAVEMRIHTPHFLYKI